MQEGLIMSNENTQLVPCISCKKLIAPNATFCSYCGAQQKEQPKELPSQMKLFILNLVWPGGGDWALGEKLRGAVLCAVVLIALLGYCNEVLPVIQKAMDMAAKGNLSAIERLEKQLNSGSVWTYVFTIGYILSFIDSFFLRIKKQKKLNEEVEK